MKTKVQQYLTKIDKRISKTNNIKIKIKEWERQCIFYFQYYINFS